MRRLFMKYFYSIVSYYQIITQSHMHMHTLATIVRDYLIRVTCFVLADFLITTQIKVQQPFVSEEETLHIFNKHFERSQQQRKVYNRYTCMYIVVFDMFKLGSILKIIKLFQIFSNILHLTTICFVSFRYSLSKYYLNDQNNLL